MVAKGKRILVVAPHPDDEAAGLSIALHRLGRRYERFIVYATTGARGDFDPAKKSKWAAYRTKGQYAQEREKEATEGMGMLEIPRGNLMFLENDSWGLHGKLQEFAKELGKIISYIRPALILSPAMEHAHPDHDSVRAVLEKIKCPERSALQEYALYSNSNGMERFNAFAPPGTGIVLKATVEEKALKAGVLSCYRSQEGGILDLFSKTTESLRPVKPLASGGIIPKEPVFGEQFSDWSRKDVIAAYARIFEFVENSASYW